MSPLTAYTLVSLLEMYRSNSTETPKKLLEDTLPCLQVDDEEKRDLYTASLTAYALTLAGEMGKARKIVDWLLSKATRGSDGRTLWWEKPGKMFDYLSSDLCVTSFSFLFRKRKGAQRGIDFLCPAWPHQTEDAARYAGS